MSPSLLKCINFRYILHMASILRCALPRLGAGSGTGASGAGARGLWPRCRLARVPWVPFFSLRKV